MTYLSSQLTPVVDFYLSRKMAMHDVIEYDTTLRNKDYASYTQS